MPRHLLGACCAFALCAAIVYSAPVFTPALQPYAFAPNLAISGFDLSTGTQKAYQTWFDPSTWRGDLAAYAVAKTGAIDVSDRQWFASERVAAQNWDTGRRIVTRNGTTNVAFRWANLSAAQQASVGDNVTGPKLVDFVRGDRSNEKQYTEVAGDGTVTVLSGSATGVFRARANVLGDIIHGRPIFVSAPQADYFFDSHDAFKSANSNRPGVVYVGANDGMLHAFSASTGDEIFAYVPSMLIGSLKYLSASPYTHTYFVDGGLAAGDVNLGTSGSPAWRTMLVGGLGAGGKGLYALDVTSAAAVDENAAKAKIQWEITASSPGFTDLGYTYGDPVIVRLNNGTWAAVVGNGYNNAGSGRSVLFVIDIATGTLVRALSVGTGTAANPGGLSAPTAVDTNADGKTDYIYAGDVDGNMWKFDLRDAAPANWTAPAAPLYSAPMPIIGAPDVAGHPLGGFMVYFGTGQLFTKAQASDPNAQNYAYGIWDGAPAGNTALLDQTLTAATHASTSKAVRVSSGKEIRWQGSGTVHKGWRTALAPGEHILTTGFIRDGRYQFTSVNPSVVNAALPNGANWLMELDYLNGGTDGTLVFDLNDNAVLDDGDRVASSGPSDVPNGTMVPVGISLGAGLYSQPLLALVNTNLATTLYNYNPFVSPGDTPETPPPLTSESGVSGGHFDFDVYHGANMASFKHTHRYDDKYNVVGANFENASDPQYNLVNTAISGNRVTDASSFFVLVSNGDLSPGVTLTIAGIDYKAYQFPNTFDGSQPVYTPASAKLFQYRMPSNAFTAKDWGTGVVRAGLMPTQTGCVKGYPYTPGQFGEVHNGALTVWIVKAGAPASAIAMNVPGKPEKGYKVIDDAWVLKKYTVFWHYGGPCYGLSGWVPNPPPDNNANSNGVGTTPAPGSQDPRGEASAAVVSVGTKVNPATTKGSNSTRVTTTLYSDGSQVVVTEVINSKGRVVSTTTTTIPAPPGGVTSTVRNPGTSTPPPPQTGYNQSRKSGKVGRIAWHELIKD